VLKKPMLLQPKQITEALRPGLSPLRSGTFVVTQNELRRPDQIDEMVQFVVDGGIYDVGARLGHARSNHHDHVAAIALSILEGGTIYIHDGHHRLVSMMLAGRSAMFFSEFMYRAFTYNDYLDYAPERGWYTPFDLRTECRLPDFFAMRQQVVEAERTSGAGLALARANRRRYAEPRRVLTLAELAERYRR
jgi:hypothetical protein